MMITNIKKFLFTTIATIITSTVTFSAMAGFAGCSTPSNNKDEIKIVTTIFPQYDWVRNIVGDLENVSITMLVDSGVDLHSFQPSVKDIATISTCDLFIYVGGESDEWVDGALENAINKDMKVLNLLELLGDNAKEEEIVEGMEGEKCEDEEEEEIEYDEHVWLSLKNASFFCDEIASALKELDKANASTYTANVTAYKTNLNELNGKYAKAVEEGSKDTLLFGDRFPFRYLVDDYDLKYYAAFVGCSAETEASFETIVFLSKKVDELNLHTILTIESTNHSIAETIKNNTKNKDQQILSMNSLQSVIASDVKNGANYLSLMENNLEVLKLAIK